MKLRELFERLPDKDKEEFFHHIERAILWRGWDRHTHKHVLCHARIKVDEVVGLFKESIGVGFDEYT